MDLEVIGRHALLFDDDATSAFVNSPDALVEWNSLSIDRYDVRHLLTSPPLPRSRRRYRNDDSAESELDRERYRDLPSQEEDGENEPEQENTGHYNAVPFSYGETVESITEINDTDGQPGFQLPFSVPDDLLQHLPPSEKVHQIIARTATFVSKHGGQSEIVLRVKQGDNPTFGFLMPDHNLHPYFRFLVDHQEVLKSDVDGNYIEEENKAESGEVGALSLLGSMYGSGDDEEAATESLSISTSSDSGKAAKDISANVSHGSGNNGSHVNVAAKDETVSKLPIPSLKNRAHIIKRNRSISTVKGAPAIELHKESEALGQVSSAVNSLQASASHSMPKSEVPILEPPSDLKRVVEKIVEFIVRNGKEFEAVLIQQDTKHGRFPFLLPSNQYHPYYLKVLQKADDARLSGKAFVSGKNDSLVHGEKATPSKENNIGSLPCDIPYDSDRKEKFKMVLGKSKKDGEEQTSKVSHTEGGFSVDAAAAAAILQAATKGIKNPNLDILSRGSLKGAGSQGNGGKSQNSNQNRAQNGNPDVSATVAKVGERTDSGDADSSETRLTKDQKLKSERLKRARMFAAMIKSGAAPLKSEPLRGLSLEPPESNFPGSGFDVLTAADRGSEGSTVPLDVDISDRVEKFVMKESVDGYNERRSKRKYRSWSKRDGEGEEVEEVEEGKFERSKKRRSHHSSRRNRDRHKHSKKHSSSKDKDSTLRRKNYSSSEEQHSGEHQNQDISSDDEDNVTDNSTSDVEYKHSKHRHKHDTTGYKHRRSRHRHKHDGSSDDEHQKHSRRKNKHDGSSDDEHIKSSRHKTRHDRSSDDEHYKHSSHAYKYGRSSDSDDEHYKLSRHTYRHGRSSDDEHYKRSRHTYRHGRSSDDEHRYTRRRHKYNCSSDEENDQQINSVSDKRSQSDKEAELEEGEIFIKSDQSKASERGSVSASREASVDLLKSYQDVGSQSQATNITGVSDDLRAKIRAMLMETL